MQINCWLEVGRKNAPKDVIRIRRVSAGTAHDLRVAIRSARKGEGDGVLFALERGFSDRGRATARLAVGVGVVVFMLAAVGAFVAPSAAGPLLGFGLIPAGLLVMGMAVFSATYDTGIVVCADGVLRAEGWRGIRELDLVSFPRVTVAETVRGSDDAPVGG